MTAGSTFRRTFCSRIIIIIITIRTRFPTPTSFIPILSPPLPQPPPQPPPRRPSFRTECSIIYSSSCSSKWIIINSICSSGRRIFRLSRFPTDILTHCNNIRAFRFRPILPPDSPLLPIRSEQEVEEEEAEEEKGVWRT